MFTILPDDVIEYIFHDLGFKSLSYFSKTCKHYRSMTDKILTKSLKTHIVYKLFSKNKTWCTWENKSDMLFCMDLSAQAIGEHENEHCVMLTLTKARLSGETRVTLQPYWGSLLHTTFGMCVLKEEAWRNSRFCNRVTVRYELLLGERLLLKLNGFINLLDNENDFFVIMWEYVSFEIICYT